MPIMSQPTAESIRGRAIGTLFFTGFGTLWIVTGLQAMHRLTVPALAPVILLSLSLALSALALMRRAGLLPAIEEDPAESARVRRVFNAVNIIQWVSVATAVVVLNLLHMPFYIVPAVAIIVGLHLYPLAGAFHYPLHSVTGTVLIAWSVGCLAMLDSARIPGAGAFGTGCILLGSAALTLLLAFHATRAVQGRALA